MAEENFEIKFATQIDENTEVITTTDELIQSRIEEAIRKYDPSNIYYRTYLNESVITTELTKDVLDDLALLPQQDLRKIKQINSIVSTYVNKDWIIGKVVEVINTNINTQYKLSYRDFEDEGEIKKLNEAKLLIDDFNDRVNLKRLIKNVIPNCYQNGNYFFYCRRTNQGHYDIEPFSLEFIEVSDYEINGEPVLLFNVKDMKKKLSRTIKKNKKNKALFFDKLDKEVKQNYPPEVYKAYKAGDDYARLDHNWTGCIRINNQDKKYGLTPIFRALYPTLILEQFDITDAVTSKAKAKKIIGQFLDPKLLDDGKNGYAEMAYAHDNLVRAFKMSTVLVTAPAYVKDIKYIEPSVDTTEPNVVKSYIERVLSTLGISFLMSANSTSGTVATIALNQLMKMINSITENLEFIMERLYRNLLIENGFDAIYSPSIQIVDSELMEHDMKLEFAKTLFSTFNCSLETALEMVGIDFNDELAKRKNENEKGVDEVFSPHASQYTTSSDDVGGRPKSDDVETVDKQTYDDNNE